VICVAYQSIWYAGVESEIGALGSAVSQNPDRLSDLRIGGRDILLFHKDLTINYGILGLLTKTMVALSIVIFLLLGGTSLVIRKRKRNAQPTTPPYSEPAARSPQG
jgi:LPXTG-motif cell wall-anchored protein